MRRPLPAATLFLGALAGGSVPVVADELDAYCSGVTTPRSVALCSDPDLRRLAVERQKAFDAARARVWPDGWQKLLTDQNHWVASYATDCGLAVDKPPPLPLPPAIRDCMAAAGKERTRYLQSYEMPNAAPPAGPVAATPPQPTVGAQVRPPPPVTVVPASSGVWWCPSFRGGMAYPAISQCPGWPGWQWTGTTPPLANDPATDRRIREEAERAATQRKIEDQQRAAEAKITADRREREEAERQRKTAAAQRVAEFETAAVARGYRFLSGKDFKLDGRELAEGNAKVAVTGIYTAVGRSDFLVVGGSWANPVTVGLLTENSTRETRARLIDCQSKMIYYETFGCERMTFLGTAVMCTRTTIAGISDEPCIAVDDSYQEPVR